MKEYWTIRLSNTCGETVRLISGDGHQLSSKGMWGIFKSAVSAKAALWTVRAREVEFCPESRNKFILCHHTVKAKPRGAKVGTWAWACEQMLSGSVVWKSAHQTRYYLSYDRELLEFTENVSAAKRATVTAQMMRDTSWGVVP